MIRTMKKMITAVLVIAAVGGCLEASATKKPNILFFYADDWGRIASCYADDDRFNGLSSAIQTPTFDRLAAEGVQFANAFYPVSQCTPCRASIGTGCYFWRTGRTAFLNQNDGFDGVDAGNKLVGFGSAMLEQGYFMAFSGKTLEGRWAKTKPISGDVGGYRYSLAIAKGKTDAEKEKIRTDLEQGYRAVIRNLLVHKGDKPFFYVYGSINTHRPWIRGSGKKLWGLNPNNLKGKLPPYLADVPEVREDMADYFGEILALDLMLRCFMEELEQAGELENTVVIATGDNGPPGFSRGKTSCYDFGTAAPLLIRWPGVVKAGRKVSDFVNLMDLSATFIDIAGGDVPDQMDAKSILPILKSDKSGQVDPSRNYVITGRERHVHNARSGNLSYPSRAIRTKDYLYIVNPHPERWPQGDPKKSTGITDPVALARMGQHTGGAFMDLDGSPTKAWVMSMRDSNENRKYWDWTFALRSREELYRLKTDTYQLKNLASDPEFKEIKKKLADLLQSGRETTADPQLTDYFDFPPWTSPEKEK